MDATGAFGVMLRRHAGAWTLPSLAISAMRAREVPIVFGPFHYAAPSVNVLGRTRRETQRRSRRSVDRIVVMG